MGKIKEIITGHQVIALDTNCFIYMLQADPWALELKKELFNPLEKGEFQAVTSTLTLLELLVKPKSLGLEEVCEQYITTLKSYPNLQLIDFNLEMAVLGAEIRAKYRVRTPDAIQLASALASDATLFFTNDLSLPQAVGNMRTVFLKDVFPPRA
ncbi:PIN domain [Moorella glycerini]|uniref:PIN domain protein n=1 Tax=Neomoorella stamsii TaxID=1266720 RepID=A0A9X7P6Q9_9FIRM|nr:MULTISPECIES: PIN domain-containing protein [Moorella]PRR74014.1 PIN domain protein [Moorella stamsii]CEP67426.1 PIN domain [Moorella glycerini]